MTGGFAIDNLALKARDLAHRKLSLKSELDILAAVAERVLAVIALAVWLNIGASVVKPVVKETYSPDMASILRKIHV